MHDKKVEIIYFYSDLQEDENELSNVSKKISQKRRDINIHLINVDDPRNEELAQLYEVNIVPTLIFLTPRGEVAARLSIPLSAEEIVQEIADKVSAGKLPNPSVEEKRRKILESLKNINRRSDLTDLIIEQIEDDLMEAITKSEITEMVNSHISAVNHTIRDLEEIKKILKKYQKPHETFVV
ncbi:hypothetical protein J7K07_05215 [Candidatus Bathyarchaeota archaeon]|nr:hypothetical protein [Candidatus Bathyarchaeota archaeon]